MDMNSYSYAPYMLDEEKVCLASLQNEDVEIELWQAGKVFYVYAYSYTYDIDLDVFEEFYNRENALLFYDKIMSKIKGGKA